MTGDTSAPVSASATRFGVQVRGVQLLIRGGQGAVLWLVAGRDVDGATAFAVDVFGHVGQQREVAERTDHRDRLADVDAVEQLRHLSPLDLRAAHPEGCDPGALDQVEDLVAVLLADGVAEDRAKQPNVFAHRLGGFAAYSSALYRAERAPESRVLQPYLPVSGRLAVCAFRGVRRCT